MRKRIPSALMPLLVIGAVTAAGSAQEPPNRLPSSAGDWMLRNLRPSGQPVIPLFDGWFRQPDGSYELCFGYHNLNIRQDVDLPLGPDNFIEPASYDGPQPTHFDEVPPEYRRRFCVFTVNVPDLAVAPDVRWTLRLGGRSYSVPGSSAEHYRMDEIRQSSRGNSAPHVEFTEPGRQVVTRGRTTVMHGAPAMARVEAPLRLSFIVTDPEGIPLGVTRLLWAKHQGPGVVSFSAEDTEVTEETDSFSHSVTAAFDRPGEYVLRLQAVDWDLGNAFGFHCCWTNAYVSVTVDP